MEKRGIQVGSLTVKTQSMLVQNASCRLTRTLVINQTVYQSPEALRSNASKDIRAADAERTWAQLVRKWSVVPNYQEVVFADDKPLGFWRKVMIDMFDANLPIPPR